MPREARTLDQANYAEMLIEKRDDGVALITLNRPERAQRLDGHHAR